MELKKISVQIILLLLLHGCLSAQLVDRFVLGAGGGDITDGTNVLEYQIGELSSIVINGESVIVKSGFIQSDWREGTQVDEYFEIESNVYPNPASTELHVYLGRAARYEYYLIDVYGRILTKGVWHDAEGNLMSLSVTTLASGAYILLISHIDSGAQKAIRFLKH